MHQQQRPTDPPVGFLGVRMINAKSPDRLLTGASEAGEGGYRADASGTSSLRSEGRIVEGLVDE